MSTLITATLAPDTGETKYSNTFILPAGESVAYTATYGAGNTQDVSFQVTSSPGSFWNTIRGPITMDGSPDNFSGTYINETTGNLFCRFKSKQTATSTDESVTVTLQSVSDQVGTVSTPNGDNLLIFSDESIENTVRWVVGSSSAPLVDTTSSQKMHVEYYSLNYAGNYGFYVRSYVNTAGIAADNARFFATVNNVAGTTTRGLHCSLSFGTTGTVSGLGVAAEFTLHIPSGNSPGGTVAPVKAAINSDSTNDPAGCSLSFYQAVMQGDATGIGHVDDLANLFEISGATIGNGNMVMAAASSPDLAHLTHGIRIKIGSTLYYVPISTTAPSGW